MLCQDHVVDKLKLRLSELTSNESFRGRTGVNVRRRESQILRADVSFIRFIRR